MTPAAIEAAAKQRDEHAAMDILETGATQEEYYMINNASREMREYLRICLQTLAGESREKFVQSWLELLKVERKD